MVSIVIDVVYLEFIVRLATNTHGREKPAQKILAIGALAVLIAGMPLEEAITQ